MRLRLSMLLLALALPARAEELRVEAPRCRPVHLVAHGVPLQRVLEALAEELKFELTLEAPAGRTVDLELRKPAPELLAALTRGDNSVIEDADEPRCPGTRRIARLWLLPAGGDTPARAEAQELTPMELYRKAHGLPPEGPIKSSPPTRPPQP